MLFSISARFMESFPSVTIGVVRGRMASPRDDCASLIESYQRQAIEQLPTAEVLGQHPNIIAWREAYQRFGVKPKKHRPTHEAMAVRLLKDPSWPKINPIVDTYLTNQVATLLPHGGYDWDALQGDVILDLSPGGEAFEPLGGGEQRTDPGEVVYRDSARVLTRRWNYRDAGPTSITETSRNFVLMLESPSAAISVEAIASATAALVARYCRSFSGEFEGKVVTAAEARDGVQM